MKLERISDNYLDFKGFFNFFNISLTMQNIKKILKYQFLIRS